MNPYPGMTVKGWDGREYTVLSISRYTPTKELVVTYKRSNRGVESFFTTPQEEFCKAFEVFDKPFFQR